MRWITVLFFFAAVAGVNSQAAAGQPTCRWSWRRLRCVSAAGDASSCTFSLRHLRCSAKAAVAASKVPQSKVAATTPAAPTQQQQQQQQQQQKEAPPQQQQSQAAATAQQTQQQPQQQQPQPPQQPAYMAPLHRGVSLQRAQRWAEAVAAYEEALAAATSFRSDAERVQILVAVNTNLGLSLQSAGRVEESLRAFDAAIDASPSNADSHHNHANALYKTGNHAAAVTAYGRAVELAPRDAES